MYAIVDIETTGGYAQSNGITEIAIVLHNGKEVEGRYETLINPGVPIPRFISTLTGINDEMVSSAKTFTEAAANIFNLLKDRIFIAHNVNFDYSFIKHHLRASGYEWNARKLCTLRLSRKAFPGLTKYGLGNLCREFDITNENRHRAGGDANATTVLFEKILEEGGEKLVKDFLKKDARAQILPPNLPQDQVNNLPYVPGVYYFKDAKGKVIYVGKAKSLKKRVVSHFTGLNTGKKRQEFLRNIFSVSFTECPTELTASIFESIEIKRLWPIYNVNQKNFEAQYGIYFFEDARGFFRLAIDKKRKYSQPIAQFSLFADAHRMLWKLVKDFELNASLCFLDETKIDLAENEIHYNKKVTAAIEWMQKQKETFVIKEQEKNKSSYILVEEGKFYGMGLMKKNIPEINVDELKPYLTQYPENEVIRSMINSYVEKYPHNVQRLAV
jgi:DNA polymerase-3 subunit epsilon